MDEQYLINLGFKRKGNSDKSAYWYELKIKHILLGNLVIVIEGGFDTYTVWTHTKGNSDMLPIFKKLNIENLNQIILFAKGETL